MGPAEGHSDSSNAGHMEDEPSKCMSCLRSGKDFCIHDNKCIERATYNCQGPRDQITGDKEFALHGNPEGIQHSMVCPKANPSPFEFTGQGKFKIDEGEALVV